MCGRDAAVIPPKTAKAIWKRHDKLQSTCGTCDPVSLQSNLGPAHTNALKSKFGLTLSPCPASEHSCIIHGVLVRIVIDNAPTVENGFFVESEQGSANLGA
jgi:hypothetical protein